MSQPRKSYLVMHSYMKNHFQNKFPLVAIVSFLFREKEERLFFCRMCLYFSSDNFVGNHSLFGSNKTSKF